MSANPNGIRMPRAERAALVKSLKEQGLTFTQIAESLGIAKSTVTSAYYDPTGEKERERKAKFYGECVDCGAPKRGASDRCMACSLEYRGTVEARRGLSKVHRGAGRKWTDEEIFTLMRIVSRDGVLTTTMWGTAYANARPGDMPSRSTLIFRFGSWRKAVSAAGLRVSPMSEARPTRYRNRASNEELLAALRECAQELGGWPTYDQYEEWAKGGRAVARNILTQRFGSFFLALEQAMGAEKVAA